MGETSYLAGCIGFIAFVAIFLVLLRLPIKTGWFLLEIGTGLAIHILTSIAGFLFIDGFSYWYQAAIYAFLWFCFFFVTSIYSASISIGILSYLYKQPQHTASLQDVYQSCIVNVFQERVEFLVAVNQVQITDQGYVITPAGRKTSNNLRMINRILGMQIKGFYSPDLSQLENKVRTVEEQ